MSQTSKIEWTDSTWNPTTGCKKVSPACKYCYAEAFANRFKGVKGHPYEQGFKVKLWPSRLTLPLKWKKHRNIFVDSMSDLFLGEIPFSFIDSVFETMEKADWHIFQVLTKRAKRMKQWCISRYGSKEVPIKPFPKNVWIGVSIENQKYVNRIESLKEIPATTKFISFEPLLGSIQLDKDDLSGINWIIVGGESGPRARAMQSEWVDGIFQICQEAQIPFFFKQWGSYNIHGQKVGKKKAGRVYRGKTWDEMPNS